jgi:hypothetical protein
VTARAHIEVEEKRFTGGPAIDDQGSIYIPHPAPMKYVGNPYEHPEIDDNWERATWGKYTMFRQPV